MKSKLKAFAWKIFWKLFPPETVADRVRAMSDRELVIFVHRIQSGDELWADFAKEFCDSCPVTGTAVINGQLVEFHQCDTFGTDCPHGDDVAWWLQQEVGHAEL